MYTMRTRPLTEIERTFLKSSFQPVGVRRFFFGVAQLCIPVVAIAFALIFLFGFLGSLNSPEAETRGRWFGGVLTLFLTGLLVIIVRLTLKISRDLGGLAAQDLRNGVVEEIRVKDARSIEIEPLNDAEPILAFDIGTGKILFLKGRWIRDSSTYRETSVSEDPNDRGVNDSSPSFSFPNSEFTIVRFPCLKRIRIDVSGDYQPTTAVVGAMKREYGFGELEIFDGSLDEIAGTLEREHARRMERDP
ncbi:MAG TPA: hypothetical protein VHR72_02250 [Gemmataceae bacterium]|jgi:hypothetical protein|nr:hypothetical protein [Gemmataceae bacterium]